MTHVQSSQTQETNAAILERLSTNLVPELKRYAKHHRSQVEAMIAKAGDDCGLAASRRHAKAIDGLASSLFYAATTAIPNGKRGPISLSAVGSYGRNSLSIFSDLDVRLLCEDVRDAEPIADALLYPLWDAGLNVGHQIVSADDLLQLATTDLPTATSLLDWRHLAGDQQMTTSFQQRLFDEVFGSDHLAQFIELLATGAEERRERFGGSVFLLEPEIKNGAGGLRDIDIAHWAARARWRVEGLGDLVRVGVLLPDEWEGIERAIEFVVRVRNSLHHRARRRVDRLTFDDQEQICELLGYGSGGAAVESFMSDYYRHAREVERTSDLVVRRAAPPAKHRAVEKPLDGGLKLVGDVVAFDDYDAIYLQPELVFTIFEAAIAHHGTVADASRRAITRAVSTESFRQQLRSDAASAESFVRLVCRADETQFKYDSILTELHDVGLLLAMIPEFAPVVGRVHHDIYHTYTVDVHSIACVDRLRAIFASAKRVTEQPPPPEPSAVSQSAGEAGGADADDSEAPVSARVEPESKQAMLRRKYRLACIVSQDIRRRRVLFLAALLHDVGKDLGGAKHAERGVELAQGILQRLGFDQDEITAAQHLIQKHLRMYHVATRRDIDDPRTLEKFSDDVQGIEGLRELFILTVCDVSTTSPTALTSWKRRMLEELFFATERWLSHGETRRAATEAIRQEVMGQLPEDLDPSFAEALLGSMPPRYLGANNSEWILRHMQLAQKAAGDPASVVLFRKGNPHVELAVIADDNPGLLAQICATFSKQHLKVVSAQIYSFSDATGKPRALDLFWVRSGSEPDAVIQLLPVLNEQLRRLVAEGSAQDSLPSGSSAEARYQRRKSPSIPVQVRVDNQGATHHTILEVIAKDRLDLLFWVSQLIYQAGLTIDLAKIHTEGDRVTDVFYLSTERDAQGEPVKLLDQSKIDELRASILARLTQLEGASE